MCTSTRYFFTCRHPATKTFRTNTCWNHDSSLCEAKHIDRVLDGKCLNCAWQGNCSPHAQPLKRASRIANVPQQVVEPLAWHIPSRHFIDPGLEHPDPFAADRLKMWLQENSQNLVADNFSRSSRFPVRTAFRERMHALQWSGRAWFLPEKFRIPIQGPCCKDARNHDRKGSESGSSSECEFDFATTRLRARAESDGCGSRY